MDGDVEALKAQIAALTAAVQALGAARASAVRAPSTATFNDASVGTLNQELRQAGA